MIIIILKYIKYADTICEIPPPLSLQQLPLFFGEIDSVGLFLKFISENYITYWNDA